MLIDIINGSKIQMHLYLILVPDDKDDQGDELARQADPEHHQVAALVPEIGPNLGAHRTAKTLDKVDRRQAECSLLGAGDLGDEGGYAHAEGDVAP